MTVGRRPPVVARLAPLVFIAVFASLAAPSGTRAHVNRTVGPYTILVTLIGEPYFATNRAGFEVWVKDAGRPVVDLDRTVRSQAVGHATTIGLVLAAMPDAGHYAAEFGPDGRPFDPLGGGAWSLRLTGSIEGMALNETFAVTFPVYPRVLAASPATAATAGRPTPATRPAVGDQPVGAIAGVVVASLLGAACLMVLLRRRARSPAPAD